MAKEKGILKAVRKKTRIIEFESPVEPSYIQEEQQIKALISDFSSRFESSPLPSLPPVSNQIINDCLLRKLLREYTQNRQEYEDLIHAVRSRWNSCHEHPGYYGYLIKLIENAIPKLTSLKQRIDSGHQDISERVVLISKKAIGPQDILAAKDKLICTLDVFILSISRMSLNPRFNPQADKFKQQIKIYIEDVRLQLSRQDLMINSEVADKLIRNLYKHVGISKGIFGLYFSTNRKPIDENKLNQLLNNLFLAEGKSPSQQQMTNQYLALHDLEARLTLYSLVDIIKHESLYACYYSQQEQIRTPGENLLHDLNLFRTNLSESISLFVGTSSKPHCLKDSIGLVDQIENEIEQIKTILKQNSPHTTAPSEWSINQLEQLTQLQEEVLHSLAINKQQTLLLEKATQNGIVQLRAMYFQERRELIDGLSNSIRNAKYLTAVQQNAELLLAIEQGQHLFDQLTRDQSLHPLSELKIKIKPHHNKLMNFVDAFKTTLKVEWANKIFSLFATQSSDKTYNIDTSLSYILIQMRIYNEPYQCLELRKHNPFNVDLKELTHDCNQSIKQLIDCFAQLSALPGEQLDSWTKEIGKRYQTAQVLVFNHKRDTTHAQTIEMRLQSRPYRACLQILGIINKEFSNMLLALSKTRFASEPDNALLREILTDPNSILLNNELTVEVRSLFDKSSPILVKLFSLLKDFQRLNSAYINVNINICSEDNYIPQLLDITTKHITDDGREFYSRGLNNAGQYVEWLHVCVYKPLLNFYVPQLRCDSLPLEIVDSGMEEELNDILKKSNSWRFFSSTSQVPEQVITKDRLPSKAPFGR